MYEQVRTTNFTNGESVRVYHVSFRPIGINPFRLERKANKINPNWGAGKSGVRKIIDITEEPVQKTQCISVDSPDNTYLCTENYIPTHNTGRRLDWATGEVKDYKKLENDPQLLLYYYAISKLYPDFPHRIMSIFFYKDSDGKPDPMPFSMCFSPDDETRFLEMLRKRVEEIRNNFNPQPLDPDNKHWKCKNLCHFAKNNWPGTNISMCQYIQQKMKEKGYDQTVKDCTRDGFDIGYYEAPG